MYSDDETLRAGLVPFVVDGLRAKQRVACFDRADRIGAVRSWLLDADLPVGELIERGRLIVGEAEAAYFAGGTFDRSGRVSDFRRLLVESVAAGYLGLRVFGEVGFMAGAAGVMPWSAYELHVDIMMARLPLIGVCGYDTRSLDPAELTLLRGLHSHEVADGQAGSHAAPPFHLQAARSPAPAALHLAGEVDYTVSGMLETVLTASASADPDLPLDVSDMAFIDTAGVAALSHVRNRVAASTGHPLQIRGASPMFRRVWTALGYDDNVLESA